MMQLGTTWKWGLLFAVWGAASAALAGFDDLSYEWVSSTDSTNTFRVYATFTNPNDELLALYGTSDHPWTLTLNGTLYQSPYGGPLGTDILEAGLGVLDGLAEDSWFTLGSETASGTSQMQQAGMVDAWAAFESGSGFSVDAPAGGGLFVLPGASADAVAGDDLRVLVAQLTLGGTAQLTTNLQWRSAGGFILSEEGVTLELPAEVGCTDLVACNYDADALVDDGSCSYTTDAYYDCEGLCLNDGDGDGVCDALEVAGCTLSEAQNFNPLATDDDGSCLAPGCTDPAADNYNANATEDDGACLYFGCMDALALNFDGTANADDGTCTYPAPSFAGLEVEEVVGWAAPGDVHVHRIYATFTNPLDELVAVFGNAEHPLAWVAGTSFVQDSAGVNGFWSPADSLTQAMTDSWLALGTGGDGIVTLGVQSALANFQGGGSLTVQTTAGGMWFIYPGSGAGLPDENGRVLLGQVASDGAVSLALNLQYRAQSGATVQALDLSVAFPALASGCLDSAACNFNPDAVLEDGSCESSSCLGCTDPTACNFDPEATQDNGLCVHPAEGLDCGGTCVEDTDGDGVCDPWEVSGCTDSNAANYESAATDDDGSCIYDGCTAAGAVNYDPEANADDGSCEFLGCMDAEAENYDPVATLEGECTYPDPGFAGLEWDAVGTTAEGVPIYRVHARFLNATDQVMAVFGNAQHPLALSSTAPFVQTEAGGGVLGGNETLDALAEDSWLTVGTPEGSADLLHVGMDEAIDTFEAGGSVVLQNAAGGMWFLLPSADTLGIPDSEGRVLLAQLVTAGQVTFVANLNVRAPDGSSVMVFETGVAFPEGTPGCLDPNACNYDESADLDGACDYAEAAYDCSGSCLSDTDGDGICDELEVPGCTEPEACNFDPAATDDDASCTFATYGTACDGSCLVDTDGDGVCEDQEVFGCLDPVACDFNPDATESGSCFYPPPGYDCAANCTLDANNNGVCDLWEDVLPCVGPSCCDDGTAWDDSLGRCVIAEPAYLNAPGELAILNPCYFDSDQDGLVSTTDLLNVLSVYGMSCPE